MWRIIPVFSIGLIFAMGIALIIVPLFPVIVYKSQWLYKKYSHEIEEDNNYKKIYNRKLTCTGKVVLVTGFFLLIIAIIWLLLFMK